MKGMTVFDFAAPLPDRLYWDSSFLVNVVFVAAKFGTSKLGLSQKEEWERNASSRRCEGWACCV
jgi:hypothetical protein